MEVALGRDTDHVLNCQVDQAEKTGEKKVTPIWKTSCFSSAFWCELWTFGSFLPCLHTVVLLFKVKFMADPMVPKPVY